MKKKPLNENDLDLITQGTLRHYQENAQSFWEGTRDHDVSQNVAALLDAISGDSGLKILDFGCGPGRDILHFKNLGHDPIGLDGSEAFCEIARDLTGCEVWQQNFLELDLPRNFFDGIFANASLFHVPEQEFPRVLQELCCSLKENGIMFSSNPRGDSEGWNGHRYGFFTELADYKDYLERSGFRVLNHYYRPVDKPRQQQPWLAVVSQKIKNPP